MKESKEDMLSGALKENVIEEGQTKVEFTKRKSDERRLYIKVTYKEEKIRNIAHKFSGKWLRNGF